MKFSYNWLQKYFEKPLPKPAKLAELITFHSLEVEGLEKIKTDTIFEIAVLPNRSHDCLSYGGMAREIGTIIGEKIKSQEIKNISASATAHLKIHVEDEKLCRRYVGRVVEGVKIKSSPKWLKDRLFAAGQRPINNVVDIMNFVMLETGQPLHAFDADKLSRCGETIDLFVRKGNPEEKLMTLDGKEVSLNENILVIADQDDPLVIAGIKGGTKAEITETTKNIIIESANFAPENIRKTSRAIGIRTDSSLRFENEITPEKAMEAIEYAVSLLSGYAKKFGETVDFYPHKRSSYTVGISVSEVNRVLGTSFEEKEVAEILSAHGFEYRIVKPVSEILRLALTLPGASYKFGASISYDAPKTFDSSSLVGYMYAQAGIQIPRISVDMFVFSERVEKENLSVGDIIFANSGEGVIYYESMEWMKGTKVPEGVDHCGLYVGEGKVIHAAKKFGKVVIEKLGESEEFKNIVGYGRLVKEETRFVITVRSERLDLRIKEDMVEEIGRIYGYEKIPPAPLVETIFKPDINKRVFYMEKIRSLLVENGFSEISTYAFTGSGEVEMENPIASDKAFLRKDLAGNMQKSLELNGKNAPILGDEIIKIFEIGKVFESEREYFSLALGVSVPGAMKKKEELIKNILFDMETKIGEVFRTSVIGKTPLPSILLIDLESLIEKAPDGSLYEFSAATGKEVRYRKISPYPFALRDIAVFVSSGITDKAVYQIIKKEAGKLLVKIKLFDVFEKTCEDGTVKTSYAFRLVFQSNEKTLSDEEVNVIMGKITLSLNAHKDWQVR